VLCDSTPNLSSQLLLHLRIKSLRRKYGVSKSVDAQRQQFLEAGGITQWRAESEIGA
jgi:hypothetical protein